MKKLSSLSMLLLLMISLFTACSEYGVGNTPNTEMTSEKIETPKSDEVTTSDVDISTSDVQTENLDTGDDNLPYSNYNMSVINQSKEVDVINSDELLAVIESS